jgi:hypothetical protein
MPTSAGMTVPWLPGAHPERKRASCGMLPSQSKTAPSCCGRSVAKRIAWWSTRALSTVAAKPVACVVPLKGERNAKHLFRFPALPLTRKGVVAPGACATKRCVSVHGSGGELLGGAAVTVPHEAPVHPGPPAPTQRSITARSSAFSRVGGIGRAASCTRCPTSCHTGRDGSLLAPRCVSAHVDSGIGAP